MMNEEVLNGPQLWLRRLGWVILLLAAGFWTLFTGGEVVSGLVSDDPEAATALVGGLMEFAVFAVPLWVGAILVWRWPPVGAALLLLDGVVLMITFVVRVLTFYVSPAALVMTALTLGLPPLASGLLFLVAWRRGKKAR
ncbi:MAG: hypothetical protein SVX38_00220 [Chloroflexota bacterium]|nr:hypothetical protein [Chloroflexota bacterium]